MEMVMGDKPAKTLRDLRNRTDLTLRDVQEKIADTIDGDAPHFTTIGRWETGGGVPDKWRPFYAAAIGADVGKVDELSEKMDELAGELVTPDSRDTWRDRVYASDLSRDAKFLTSALAYFYRKEVSAVTLTLEGMSTTMNLDEDYIEEHWPEVVGSDFVEMVGDVKWVLRLRFPDAEDGDT